MGLDGREFGHLLPDDAHLLAVRRVLGNPSNFFTHGRANSPASGCLAQGNANGIGIAQPIGPDDRKCGYRSVIETNMKGARHLNSVAQMMLQGPTGNMPATKPGKQDRLPAMLPNPRSRKLRLGLVVPLPVTPDL